MAAAHRLSVFGRGRRWALPFVVATFASCAPGTTASRDVRDLRNLGGVVGREGAAASSSSVVLLVLDGARWQEIFSGVDASLAARAGMAPEEIVPANLLLPNLYGVLATRGAALGATGAEVFASGPNFVSLPGYTEIFTGRPSRCTDNECPQVDEPTVLDELAVMERSGTSAVISSWERIERAAAREDSRVVISAGRTHGVTRDALRYDAESARLLDGATDAAPWPGELDFRRDASTAAIGLHYLREMRPRFLFLGLGEPDEFAHRGDYRGYLGSLRAADAVVGEILVTLDAMGDAGKNTTLLVTTDHGRGADFRNHGGAWPESSRVWIVGAGRNIEARGVVESAPAHHLFDVVPTVRTLLDLPRDRSLLAGAPLDELFEASNTAPR